jgi:hypothetical protein
VRQSTTRCNAAKHVAAVQNAADPLGCIGGLEYRLSALLEHSLRRFMNACIVVPSSPARTSCHVATRRTMLQHAAPCCNTPHHVATRRTMLQQVATSGNTRARDVVPPRTACAVGPCPRVDGRVAARRVLRALSAPATLARLRGCPTSAPLSPAMRSSERASAAALSVPVIVRRRYRALPCAPCSSHAS